MNEELVDRFSQSIEYSGLPVTGFIDHTSKDIADRLLELFTELDATFAAVIPGERRGIDKYITTY